MGVDSLRVESGLLGQGAKDQEGAGPGQPAAPRVQEELRAVPPVEKGASPREVAPTRCAGGGADRHDPLLPALADPAQGAVVEVDPGFLEPDAFADAQACAVEE